MNLNTGYFVGSLMLGIPYCVIFILRKDLRKEILFGSLALLPFALTAPFFIPEYWNPPYLFGLIKPFAIGIEDIIFTFFVGGITSTLFEFLKKKKEIKARKSKFTRKKHFFVYFLALIAIYLSEYFLKGFSIYNLILITGIFTIYALLKRHDLFVQSIYSGVFFTTVYFIMFVFFQKFYPSFIHLIYNNGNLLGIYFSGVPVEEILFAFAAGSGWSIAYEFLLNYKTS